ncbi:MAG: pyrroline-5-carboxylate reductase [Thermodesulfobacteriota bacterium]
MFKGKTIGFIGAGNISEAIIKGILSAKLTAPSRVIASDKDSGRLASLAEKYEIRIVSNNSSVVKDSDVVIFAVKPSDMEYVLLETAKEFDERKLLISVAAGKRTKYIENTLVRGGLKNPPPVIRAMPNTPALVGEGATGIFAGEGATKDDTELACKIFSSIGEVIVVKDDSAMDAITGVSGSGPAYVFLFMASLMEAAEKEGISRDDAKKLVLQTTLGAAKLAKESGAELFELIRMVSSPGGTTVAGLKVFEESGIRKIVEKAVAAAVKKAKELSEG